MMAKARCPWLGCPAHLVAWLSVDRGATAHRDGGQRGLASGLRVHSEARLASAADAAGREAMTGAICRP